MDEFGGFVEIVGASDSNVGLVEEIKLGEKVGKPMYLVVGIEVTGEDMGEEVGKSEENVG